MRLTSQRHLFDIPEDVTYLNCAYMSPLMNEVRRAGVEGLIRKAHPWEIRPEDFFTGSDRLRAAFAELVGADASDIAIVPAASYGVSTAARNLPLAAGDDVLVVEDQFPSNVYPWIERVREAGASLRKIDRPGDGDWTKAVLEGIGRRTTIVALPQCHWTDGGLFDLERIAERCREQKIALSLDVTQSAGACPIDVGRIQPDFMTAATYKWLLGPYSLGLLYVSKRWQEEGVPIEHNWIHRKGSENFARLADYQDSYAAGAVRYDVGERANFALVPAAEKGLRRILAWGVSNIAESLAAMTAQIAERVRELGFETPPAGTRAGHYIGLKMKGDPPEGLLAKLAERKVYVGVRGSSIRVTPHLYNDDRDIGRLLEALRDAT